MKRSLFNFLNYRWEAVGDEQSPLRRRKRSEKAFAGARLDFGSESTFSSGLFNRSWQNQGTSFDFVQSGRDKETKRALARRIQICFGHLRTIRLVPAGTILLPTSRWLQMLIAEVGRVRWILNYVWRKYTTSIEDTKHCSWLLDVLSSLSFNVEKSSLTFWIKYAELLLDTRGDTCDFVVERSNSCKQYQSRASTAHETVTSCRK